MEAIQIHAAPSTYDIIMLAADGARENRAFEPSGPKWLAAPRTSVVVRVQSFFEPAEKNFASADFLRSQSSGRNCVETKHFLPSDRIAFRFRLSWPHCRRVAKAAQTRAAGLLLLDRSLER